MPEYRRFIAYFYEYIDGKKQRNTGFVKVELRNGMWRILFRLNVGSVPEPPIQVYGFVREGGYLLGLPMGVMRPGREISEEWAYRAEMPVGKDTYRLEDLSGIRIQSGDGRCFMTVWDDEEIDPDRFVLRLPEELARPEPDDAANTSAVEAKTEKSVRLDERSERPVAGTVAESETSARPDERSKQPAVGTVAESERSVKSDERSDRLTVGTVTELGISVRSKNALVQDDIEAAAESEASAKSNKVPRMVTVDSMNESGKIMKARDALQQADIEAASEAEMSAIPNGALGMSAADSMNESGKIMKARDALKQDDIEATSEAEMSVIPNEALGRFAADSMNESGEIMIARDSLKQVGMESVGELEMSAIPNDTLERLDAGSKISAKPNHVSGMPAAVKSETFVKSNEVPELSGVGSMAEAEAVMTSKNASGTSALRAADVLGQGMKKEGQAAGSTATGSANGLPPSPRSPVIIHAQSANQKTAGKDHRSARANCMRDLLQRRERFEPFQDDEIVNCVQIMPCDIVRLQQEQWQVGRSSFLQHGYYQYRHLLLGTMRDGRYILGVPGMRNPQEKYMAEMFGFPHFKTSKICSCGRAFGYWYKELQE